MLEVRKNNVALITVIVVALLATGIIIWQSFEAEKDEENNPVALYPNKGQEKAPSWITYQNKEYGFEFDYPAQVLPGDIKILSEEEIPDSDLYVAIFSYTCNAKKNPALETTLKIKVADNSASLPLEEWVEQYEPCDISEYETTNVPLAGTEGIKIEGLERCATDGELVKEKVYLPNQSQVFVLQLEYDPLSENIQECLPGQTESFQKMTESFNFIQKNERFINILYPRKGETLKREETYMIRWESKNVGFVDIVLFNSKDRDYKREIVVNHINSGSLNWFVPPDERGKRPTEGYVLEIRSSPDPLLNDISESFNIVR
ncbi:MAG: hypothetical protein GF370_03755 [Candidatus Nealsonbacteria bacterium]|nr:hypothetical protein [Candidatus Nealsonbacteria bacterium]